MIRGRNRGVYLILVIVVILLGLGSRSFSALPNFINLYIGDMLWALMIFLFMGLIFKNQPTIKVGFFALLFCMIIEISQLYQANWIIEVRGTTMGGLVLGYGFLWSDIASYIMGVLLGVFLEKGYYENRK